MKLSDYLQKYFGHKSFRPGQKEIIEAIIENKNVLAVLPTGAGKSLCYQLPALILNNFSIVISPLIALMKDQVDSLNKTDEVAAFINSSQEYYETETVFRKLSEGKIKLLYLAPERLESVGFSEKIKNLKPNYLFVDEAHCISEWGHNFRPSYRKIVDFIEYVGIKKVSGFTATATPEVIKDIVTQLKMKEPKIFVRGFERENLSINVFITNKKKEKLLEILRLNDKPAIIYSSSRRVTEELSDFLNLNKISTSYYHAGLNSSQRKKIQENFINDKSPVIVATNAFGMGIDKKDIRTVVHYNLPGSIENYYQEIGRAGRDGKEASTFLLFDQSDISIQEFFINSANPDKELVTKIYNSICNYAKISIGEKSAKEIPINIDYLTVTTKREITKGLLSSTLRILENSGYIKILSEFDKKDKLVFLYDQEMLKSFVKKTNDEEKKNIIMILLREFGGAIFNAKTNISIAGLAIETGLPEDRLSENLLELHKKGIVEFEKSFTDDAILLKSERVKGSDLKINSVKLNEIYFNSRKKLDEIINLAYAQECRFKVILQYFGEDVTNYKCGKCDNCNVDNRLPFSTYEYLEELVLRTVYESKEALRERDIVNILLGKTNSQKLKDVPTFSSGANYSKKDLTIVLRKAIETNHLKKDILSETKIYLTNKGKDLLLAKGVIQETEIESNYEETLALYHQLKEVRTKVGIKFNQPNYLIISDEILQEISRNKPESITELYKIKGINERTLTKIGNEIIECIKNYDLFHSSSSDISQEKQKLPTNLIETQKLVTQNYSLKEIAELRNQSMPIISMQIESIIEIFPETDITYLIEKEKLEKINNATSKGLKDLKTIKSILPQNIEFAEIRIALAKIYSNSKSS
ncbi:MAG: hypothetical protein C0425_08240 [Chlorobiaceae bacterium]|nr:hypothetical protein [Chlorobiaceae bacterium]MBA4310310.1 hypothetical protein [Chlorobiaceae bacterium]